MCLFNSFFFRYVDDAAPIDFKPLPDTGRMMCYPLVEDASDVAVDEVVVFGKSIHR